MGPHDWWLRSYWRSQVFGNLLVLSVPLAHGKISGASIDMDLVLEWQPLTTPLQPVKLRGGLFKASDYDFPLCFSALTTISPTIRNSSLVANLLFRLFFNSRWLKAFRECPLGERQCLLSYRALTNTTPVDLRWVGFHLKPMFFLCFAVVQFSVLCFLVSLFISVTA